ncbi:hypothetical protein C4546_00480 [Candidatus Parcubacteria bacterium]|jgi:subtilisin family serine protease|nr:MAG: hypothetical protein C4546_00480 [Candidatus Parcubacteria bacterium]
MIKRNWFLIFIVAFLGLVFLAKPQKSEAKIFEIVIKDTNSQLSLRRVEANDAKQALETTMRQTGVKSAEINVKYHLALTPNDPDFSQQWALNAIGAPIAWETDVDTSDVLVAVLDSGVDINNPDLVENIWTNPNEQVGNGIDDDNNGYIDDVHGWSFVENTNDPRPQITTGATTAGIHHGTVISGIIGARGNNGLAGTGLAWNAKILPVRVLDSTGSGNTLTVAKGIEYAVSLGAKIINLSFVGSGSSPTLAAAISAARTAGVMVVAAAGNENLNLDVSPQYPVCYPGVFGVASIGQTNQKSSFSNYGSCVDISAPGENIYSTLFYESGQGYSTISSEGWYGTSVASPFVAGAAALLRSVSPSFSVEETENLLKQKAFNLSAANPDYISGLGAGALMIDKILNDVSSAQNLRANVLAVPLSGDTPRVRELTRAGSIVRQFITGSAKVQVGVNLATGDLDGDQSSEIITAFQTKSDPRVRIYNRQGRQTGSFLAYPAAFRGGVAIAVGDVNGDGLAEIVTGTHQGTAHIRIFNSSGQVLSQFFAFSKTYKGGVRLAIGDLDGDGQNEIIVSKANQDPRLAIFDWQGKQKKAFRAFPLNVTSGLNVAAGDVNSDGKAEIIVGLTKGQPKVRIFNSAGQVLKEYFAYDKSQTGGVQVAVGHINTDGILDVVTGTGPGAKPEIRAFQNSTSIRIMKFNAYSVNSRTGVNITSILSS